METTPDWSEIATNSQEIAAHTLEMTRSSRSKLRNIQKINEFRS